MINGNEIDCICAKPKGKHRRFCDSYRLSEFFKKAGAIKVVKSVKVLTV